MRLHEHNTRSLLQRISQSQLVTALE